MPRASTRLSTGSPSTEIVPAVIAGGTDLLGLMKDRITGPKMPQPEVLVNIKTIPELKRITTQPNGDLRIGASVILQDLEECPTVVASFPMLVEAAASVATTQIRAMGTVGGNLCQRPWCWYFRHPQFVCYKRGGKQCFAIPGENSTYFSVLARGICVMSHPSDLAPALMALSARIGAAGPSGRREIPIEEFFQGPRSVPETKLEPGEISPGSMCPHRRLPYVLHSSNIGSARRGTSRFRKSPWH